MVGIGRRKSIGVYRARRRPDSFYAPFVFRLAGARLARGIRLFLGIILLAAIIAGVVLNTVFLVREIRRGEQHDAFINAVTHELKPHCLYPALRRDN